MKGNNMDGILPWKAKRDVLVKKEETTDPSYGCQPEKRSLDEYLKFGIINLDKQSGPTSHEIVAWVKRTLKVNHAGHGGTLEAYAGVIPKLPVFYR
jgi:H/ACA ribonucleoprotein complex subunit 4